MFEPIAIIGRSCLLPGALSPEQLWQQIQACANCLAPVSAKQWRLDPKSVLPGSSSMQIDRTTTDISGYIQGFETLFNPAGFALAKDYLLQQDQLNLWLLHLGREALLDAHYSLAKLATIHTGAIIGNLSYPTDSLSQYAESLWLQAQGASIIGEPLYHKLLMNTPHPINRFMSGYPTSLLAQALGLTAEHYAIDAACASSLYAIKLACDALQDGRASMMLAGGINAADSLFLHMGFSALHALSKSGQSLPLHREADGLIPAQGAGLVVLKRLSDAIAAHDHIYGVIRGVGLANDGASRGFLAPDENGQVRALQKAYQISGIDPATISWVDCHATGTLLGDAVEIRSMQAVFPKEQKLCIGALKANIGHSITASGIAALINVLSAFKEQIKPPTRLAPFDPADVLANTAYRLLEKPEVWQENPSHPRRAGINCFGFGGNNAHLIVEEYIQDNKSKKVFMTPARAQITSLAIVGIGIVAASAQNREQFTKALFEGTSLLTRYGDNALGGYTSTIDLSIKGLRFPPNDLQRCLGQQLAILKAAQEAIQPVKNIHPAKTSVLIGMQCDPEIARCGLSWRLPTLLHDHDSSWIANARAAIRPPLQAADIIGTMPNIVSNRINQQYDFKAPSFSISCEELSGVVALQIGMRELNNHEIDTAIIGAVDMSCELVHQTAAHQLLGESKKIPGDAAVVIVVKRLEDAQRDQDTIYALLDSAHAINQQTALQFDDTTQTISSLFGHAHAASGLLHIASAALACHERLLPMTEPGTPTLWLSPNQPRTAVVKIHELGGQSCDVNVQEYADQNRLSILAKPMPMIAVYSGQNKTQLINALQMDESSNNGPMRLAIAAKNENEFLQKKIMAQQWLSENHSTSELLPPGVYFQAQPIIGELAFVFTTATTSYAGMGQDLLLSFPHLVELISQQMSSLPEILTLLKKVGSKTDFTMFEELKTYSFISQLHALFTQQILKIKPVACIGYCSGETNALVALNAWRDMEKLFLDIEASQIYTKTLLGEFSVLDKTWQSADITQPKWVGWRVYADVNAVKKVIANQPLVRLTIINSTHDCIIAGQSDACQNVLALLNHPKASYLPFTMLIHCPEFQPAANIWRQLHYRKTFPVAGVRFYSSGSGHAYEATADTAAQALLSQACTTVDFPRVVRKAFEDGVRIFIEHGPRNLCSQWIKEILQDKEHLVVALDTPGVDALTQCAYATAKLLAAGVHLDDRIFARKKPYVKS